MAKITIEQGHLVNQQRDKAVFDTYDSTKNQIIFLKQKVN